MKWKTLKLINKEVARARKVNGRLPSDLIYRAAIVIEEAGELIKAALKLRYEGGSIEQIREEALHTAATCVRLLEERLGGK